MRNFRLKFEELGYTFQSNDVLEDVYLFYKYYNNEANKGVSAILLEGDPGCGKTYLSEVFSNFLGKDTEYIYAQCVEETNSDKLIATYNVPAIVKGDADKSVAEGILTKAINLANSGKKVVLTIDELDKAREALDSYFLNFLQNGKIETSDNEILSLTEEGRKNLYVILAKNNERNLLEALLRRCSVIKLPPMPPVLAYKTLLRKFEGVEHDPKFLKFISKVYEAIYNEQMESNCELLTRLPALQELVTAITSDNELYENGISSTRRINNLIRKLGKDDESREIITNILVKKFKYKNTPSNYNTETLDLSMNDPDDYMNSKDPNSLVEKYIEQKDSGEIALEDEEDDPMSEIANILDEMKDDKTLVFLNKEDKEKIVELGVLTHKDPKALQILFDKIRFKGNPNSRFGFLQFENDNFIALMKYKNSLILIANKEHVSPRLFMEGLSTIIKIIYDSNENDATRYFYFSPVLASDFKLTSLNAKILSHIPNTVLNKMQVNNGQYVYQEPNLKITYDENLNVNYFRYLQKHKAEPLYDAIEKMCRFNPELAIPASFIGAKYFSHERSIVRRLSDFEKYKEQLKEKDDWDIEIEEFPVEKLTFWETKNSNSYWEKTESIPVTDDFVFDWVEEKDYKNKKMRVYPKYRLKDGNLLYTSDKDYEESDAFQRLNRLNPFQKEIALIARSIYGNFIPDNIEYDYFSSLTMSQTGRIVDDPNHRNRLIGMPNDITVADDFTKYYDSLSYSSAVLTPNKVLKLGKKNG